MSYLGQLYKMKSTHNEIVEYQLELNEIIDMNQLVGKSVSIKWSGKINCVSCSKSISKTFGQGFCYPCFLNAPEASECIIRPELCRAHLGQGRNVDWEEKNHNQPHIVYLAATNTVKVGITRSSNVFTRWVDQGASSSIILAETPNRYTAGLLEVALKDFFTDKTNWQRMLKNEIDNTIDLTEEKWKLENVLPSDLFQHFTEDDTIYNFNYPVNCFPSKIKSLTFDKEREVSGILNGIKGQYLLFDNDRVINLRKHTGYWIEIAF
jgi:hypothetical protein